MNLIGYWIILKKKGLCTGAALFFVAFSLFLWQAEKLFSPNWPVEAQILVVEGWMEPTLLRLASKEYCRGDYHLMVTTGFTHRQGFTMGMNGLLVFSEIDIPPTKDSLYTIEFILDGTKAECIYAHFNIRVDDSLIRAGYVDKMPILEQFIYHKSEPPKTINIEFDNDRVAGEEDRNLVVHSLKVNGVNIPVNSDRVEYYVYRNKKPEYLKSVGKTVAHQAAAYSRGISGCEKEIVAVGTNRKRGISRTFSTAASFAKWIGEAGVPEGTSINVVSTGFHGRRSYMAYKRAIPKYQVGIITLEDPDSVGKKWYSRTMVKEVIRETGATLFALFLF